MTATFPFNAPPMQRETMRAVKLFDNPKAMIEIVTPVNPISRTGLRPRREKTSAKGQERGMEQTCLSDLKVVPRREQLRTS